MGAKAFLVKVTPEKRREIARKAAAARWKRATKAERSEAARHAVLARWASVKAGRVQRQMVPGAKVIAF